MSTPTIDLQRQYEALCSEEQRVRDDFVCTRDSGRASVNVIAEHHKRFNDAILARADFQRRFPAVREPMSAQAAVQTNYNPSDVNASTPWQRGQL
jgi:hypothetical protein